MFSKDFSSSIRLLNLSIKDLTKYPFSNFDSIGKRESKEEKKEKNAIGKNI